MSSTETGTDTRERILRAAERLYAEHGIDAVSRADINRESGVKNRSAVNYHFGDKEALLLAILERRESQLREHRERLIAELRADAPLGPREIAIALVRPLGAMLHDSEGGHAYLLIAAQLVGHPSLSRYDSNFATVRRAEDSVASHFSRTLSSHSDERFLSRAMLVTGMMFHSFADYVRLQRSSAPSIQVPSPDDYVDDVIECLAAIIAAPLPTAD